MTRDFKVVVFGAGGVGKSAMAIKYVQGEFIVRHDPTVEDFYRKEIMVGGNHATIEILDTAGIDQFSSMRDLYIRNGHGFLLLYSIDRKQSFTDVIKIRDQIHRVKATTKVPIVLVGTKSDIDHMRQVPVREVQAQCQKWNCPFLEISSKTGRNVDAAFDAIIQQILLHQKPNSKCSIM